MITVVVVVAVVHARHVPGSAKMKITSTSQFRQILKRGLTKVLNDDAWPSDSELEEQQGIDQLDQSLSSVFNIYDNLRTSEAKEAFERHLLENIESGLAERKRK